jgi:hypothetical protein
MTSPAHRTVMFGDVEAGRWGVAWSSGGHPPVLVLGADGRTAALAGALHGTSSNEEWRIDGDGIELVAFPAGEPVDGAGDAAGFDQLCRIEGRFELQGAEQSVISHGVRTTRASSADAFDSMRQVAAWFEPADGLALTALRPAGSKGHDADVVSAAVLDAESSGPVEDPRLSTTYAGDGWASRAGLELWLGGEEEQQILRRAAGEAIGARGSARTGDLELQAELFRWHSGGRDGTGVYLLTRRP